MKHERGMEELLGQNGTSGGESGQQTSFYTGQSVYGNYTSARGGGEETGKEKEEEGKVLCLYLPRLFMHLLSSFLCYSTEAHQDTD